MRLAVVRTTLTSKAAASGVQMDKPIEVATRELLDVTDVRSERGGAVVKYTWRWKPTKMADAIGYTPAAPQEATAHFRRSDDGWVLEDAGVKVRKTAVSQFAGGLTSAMAMPTVMVGTWAEMSHMPVSRTRSARIALWRQRTSYRQGSA